MNNIEHEFSQNSIFLIHKMFFSYSRDAIDILVLV